MRKHVVIPFIGVAVLILGLIEGCGTSDDEPQFYTGPKGSELAQLMRAMYDDAENMKKAINEGKKPPFGVEYSDMLTAEPTDPAQVRTTTYELFSASFISSLEALEDCETHEADSLYTVMVQSCEGCHSHMCPGVLKKIGKLHDL